MSFSMRPWLILLNDFAHDLFTGLWCGGFITLWLLRERQPVAFNALAEDFYLLCLASLGMVAVTGMVRAFTYRDASSAYPPELKRRMLAVKHAVLGPAFLLGTWQAYLWSHP